MILNFLSGVSLCGWSGARSAFLFTGDEDDEDEQSSER